MPSPHVVKSSRPANAPQTVWELYNEKARKRDKLLLKDWNSSINSLLLFAAIFAAVLTAFCIESLQLLQPDPQDSLDDIRKTLRYIALKDTDTSHLPPIPPSPFVPPQWAIAVNGLFFTSLAASILAAIGAVICLQWVGEYDAGLEDATTPEQRALRWHYRYRSTENWYMRQTIAALPILLYVAVTLFFVGLEEWFASLCPRLRAIPLVGVGVWAGGYIMTNILAVLYPSVPYRTPMSRLLFRIFWLAHFYIWKSIQVIINLYRPFMQLLLHIVTPGDASHRNRYNVERAVSSREVKEKLIDMYPWMPPGRDPWQSMHANIWERGRVERDSTIRLSAISWLANSLDLSIHSKTQFKLLLEELNRMEDSELCHWPAYAYDAPWSYIFNLFVPLKNGDNSVVSYVHSAQLGILSSILQKMCSHPTLFTRIIPDLNGELVTRLINDLVTKSPSESMQAKNRLLSVTAILSSKTWETMSQRKDMTQPYLSALQVIFDCLKASNPEIDEPSTSWIFTLCHASAKGESVEWPNPEFIGFVFDPFRNDLFRQRAIMRYIQFVDCILSNNSLPKTNTRWRWDIAGARAHGDHRVFMLQILTEHLLRISSSLSNGIDTSLLHGQAESVTNDALKLILRTCGSVRDNAEMILSNNSDEVWADSAWLYALELWFTLKAPWESPSHLGNVPSGTPTQFIDVIKKMVRRHHPMLDKLIAEVTTKFMRRMNLDCWKQVIDTIYEIHETTLLQQISQLQDPQYNEEMSRYSEDLRQYASWMVGVAPHVWVDLFAQFMDSPRKTLLIDILRQYSGPIDRWKMVSDQYRSEDTTNRRFSFFLLVESTLRRHRPKQQAITLHSPLPSLLDHVHAILHGDGDNKSLLLNACLAIIDCLAERYLHTKKLDEGLQDRFKAISFLLQNMSKASTSATTSNTGTAIPTTPLEEALKKASQAAEFNRRSENSSN